MSLGEALFGAFSLPFMAAALSVLLALAVVAATIGVLVNLRGLEFVSDGLTHAVFPGLAIGVVAGGGTATLVWALLAAALAAVILTFLERRGVASDTAIAIILTATFSVGMVIISSRDDFSGQLESLLFGRVLTVGAELLTPILVLSGAALIAVLLTLKQQLFRAFDPSGARVSGQNLLATDLILNIAIAMIVVAAASTIGTLLVLALLIVPGAVARLFTNRLWLLFPAAIVFAALAAWLGLAAGFAVSVGAGIDVPGGASVAATFILGYAIVLVFRVTIDRMRRVRT